MNKSLLLILILVVVVVGGVSVYAYSNYAFYTNIVSPLQQKAQDQNYINQVSNTIQELNNKVLETMNTGNEISVNTPIRGTWNIDSTNNFISIAINNKLTNYAAGVGWIQLSDNTSTTIMVRADSNPQGNDYDIMYKISFNNPWKVLPGGKSSSTNVKSVAITKNGNNIVLTLLE